MSAHTDTIDEFVASDYKYGFVTDIESESLEPGLNEDVVRFISAKNEPEWLLEWRLKALDILKKWRARPGPREISAGRFSGHLLLQRPKKKGDGPKSLDEVDPKLLETYEKLGVPLHERLVSPASRSMRCSTASRSAPRSRRTWPGPRIFVPSPRRCRNTRNW